MKSSDCGGSRPRLRFAKPIGWWPGWYIPSGTWMNWCGTLAERQMKRLNEILAILTDPQRRYEYDICLGGATRLVASSPAAPGPTAANSGAHRVRPVKLNVRPEPWWMRAPAW